MSRRLLPLIVMTAVLAVAAFVRTVRMQATQAQSGLQSNGAGQVVGMPR